MKNFPLRFADWLQVIAIGFIVIGVFYFIGIFWSGMPGLYFFWCLVCFLGAAFWYALAVILKAAAIYLQKNKPESKEKED